MRFANSSGKATETMRLTGHICPIVDLSPRDRDQMFALMQRYYENVNRETFDQDLREKDFAIVARDPGNGAVCGFSTQVVYDQQAGSETVRVLFSGDTIIDRRFWGRNPLARLWGRSALSLIDHYPNEQLFWFLISKGYKTYRFLPVFFQEFYPRYDLPTPSWARRLISECALDRFGEQFCPSTGILKASEHGCRLRSTVADVTEHRLQNPHIAFFNRANPGHAHGDELCCIAPLSRENFCRTAFQVIGSSADVDPLPHALQCVSRPASRQTESKTR